MSTSQFAVKFNKDSSPAWNNDGFENTMFLKYLEHYFNDYLKVKGYVVLKDVYERLELSITTESLIAGWKFKDKDSFIQFELYPDGEGYIIDFNCETDPFEVCKLFE